MVVEATANLVDRHAEINYENRFLDSLSGILHFTSECSAVAYHGGGMVLSYNKSIPPPHAAGVQMRQTTAFEEGLLNQLKVSVSDATPDISRLTGLYVMSNKSFIQELRGINNGIGQDHPSSQFMTALSELIRGSQEEFKTAIREGKSIDALCTAAYTQYRELLNSLPGTALNPEHKMQLLRPLQDCVKACDHIRRNPDTRVHIMHMELLRNDTGLHAEHNIHTYAPGTPYIGIAKLSCGYCNETLGHDVLNHRGTHGVVDSRWKPDEQRNKLRDRLHHAQLEAPRAQHRRLSTDMQDGAMNENAIPLPDHDSEETFAQFKARYLAPAVQAQQQVQVQQPLPAQVQQQVQEDPVQAQQQVQVQQPQQPGYMRSTKSSEARRAAIAEEARLRTERMRDGFNTTPQPTVPVTRHFMRDTFSSMQKKAERS
jgi:hypothetical protein